MNPLLYIADYLINSWLWGATIDWIHLLFCVLILTLLIRYVMRKNLWRSFMYSFLLRITSFGLFTTVALGLFIMWMGWHHEPIKHTGQLRRVIVFEACISLAIVYSFFDACILGLIKLFKRKLSLRWYVLCSAISNLLAAVLSYTWIWLFLWDLF